MELQSYIYVTSKESMELKLPREHTLVFANGSEVKPIYNVYHASSRETYPSNLGGKALLGIGIVT
jgi:hypothetical protein